MRDRVQEIPLKTKLAF